MLRDDRRGDDRRDEKDHKDRDRKRKHEAPTFFAFFYKGARIGSTGPRMVLGCSLYLASLRWLKVEMQCHAQVEGESANDDRKAQLQEIQMSF